MIQQYLMGLLILGSCMSVMVGADLNQTGPDPDFSGTGHEIQMATEPAVPEIPGVPDDIEKALEKAEPVTGKYNVSRLIEITNEEGGYAFAQFDVVNASSWGYGVVTSNSSHRCFVTLYVMATNAEKVLFRGHAISPDNHVAYAGIGLMDDEWDDAKPYSGIAKLTFIVDGNESDALTEIKKGEGTITHLTRAYHVIDNSSYEAFNLRDVPGLEWNPEPGVAPDPAGLIFYDQYAGSFLNITNGTGYKYRSSAVSSPNGASSKHELYSGRSTFLRVDTQSEQWPVGHTKGEGRVSSENFEAKQVNAFNHTGYSWFDKNSNRAFGKSDASAEYVSYDLVSTPDGQANRVVAFSEGNVQAGSGKPFRSDSSLPASFSGWIQAEERDSISRISEGYTLHGAYVERLNSGGTYNNSTRPTEGVLTNLSVGIPGTPPGASKLQGYSVLTVNNVDSDPTTLDGRWIVSSPPGIRATRFIEARNTNTNAFSDFSTVSGYRNIKEMAYSHSDMVDVQ